MWIGEIGRASGRASGRGSTDRDDLDRVSRSQLFVQMRQGGFNAYQLGRHIAPSFAAEAARRHEYDCDGRKRTRQRERSPHKTTSQASPHHGLIPFPPLRAAAADSGVLPTLLYQSIIFAVKHNAATPTTFTAS